MPIDEERFIHYQIGIGFIDDDHKEILELADSVISFSNLGEVNREELLILLEKLLITVKEHYVREERLMKEIDFPFLNEHIRVHVGLLFNLEKSLSDFRNGGWFKSGQVRAFYNATYGHIDTMDSQYLPSYKEWIAKQTK